MKDIPFNKPHHGLSFLKKHPAKKNQQILSFQQKM
jgi:hypothetical protein